MAQPEISDEEFINCLNELSSEFGPNSKIKDSVEILKHVTASSKTYNVDITALKNSFSEIAKVFNLTKKIDTEQFENIKQKMEQLQPYALAWVQYQEPQGGFCTKQSTDSLDQPIKTTERYDMLYQRHYEDINQLNEMAIEHQWSSEKYVEKKAELRERFEKSQVKLEDGTLDALL